MLARLLPLFLYCACGPSNPYVNDPRHDVDVNGDGFADLVGMDVLNDTPFIAIHFGGPDFFDGLAPEDNAEHEPDVEITMQGTEPVAAGDVDGDGTTDIVLPRQRAADDFGVAVFHGGDDGLSDTRQTVLELPNASQSSGLSTFWIGDVGCDGFDDVGVNAIVVTGNQRIDGWWVPFDASGPGEVQRLDGWGNGVGDVDGDGCDDVMVGDTLYRGSTEGLVATEFTGLQERFVNQVRPIDLNGDGLADLFHDGAWYLGQQGGLPQPFRGQEYVWANLRAPAPQVDFTGDGLLDYVGYTTNGPEFTDFPNTAWMLDTVHGRTERELTSQQIANEVRHTLVPELVYVNRPDAVQRYLGSPGDIDGDGYPDLFGDGRLTDYGFIAPGGRRFRAEVTALVPTANGGWAGVVDNGR